MKKKVRPVSLGRIFEREIFRWFSRNNTTDKTPWKSRSFSTWNSPQNHVLFTWFSREIVCRVGMHLRNSSVRTGSSSGAHFFKRITGMPSGPLDLELSRFLMILLTCFTVTEGVERLALVRLGKTGRERPPSSRDEFLANALHRISAFSAEVVAILSEPVLRAGTEDLFRFSLSSMICCTCKWLSKAVSRKSSFT